MAMTDKIKNLFHFIDFLHSNIDNFKEYDVIIESLYSLDIDRNRIKPKENYKEKLKYDVIQAEISDKFSVIERNIITPIKGKVSELNICDFENTETLHNWNMGEILNLKNNFTSIAIQETQNYIQKYIEFRENTKYNYFSLDFFFQDLDEVLKPLSDFFKDTDKNEFETFEAKTVKANSMDEANYLLKKGVKSITIPNEIFNSSKAAIKVDDNIELPELSKTVIVHYGCSSFDSEQHIVFWIGAVFFNPDKTYFFESQNEGTLIERFNDFLINNRDKTFIHWSMNSPKYGFKAISNRYFEIKSKILDLTPLKEIDLSEYLKNKYGVDYIEREGGRLNNLAKLNHFSGIKSQVEVININDATNRLELIFSIVQAELQGKLKIDSNTLTIRKPPKIKKGIKLEPKQLKAMKIIVEDMKGGKKIGDATRRAMRLTEYSKSAIETIIRKIRNNEYNYAQFKEIDPKANEYYLTSGE
jgi:hypothetical protein